MPARSFMLFLVIMLAALPAPAQRSAFTGEEAPEPASGEDSATAAPPEAELDPVEAALEKLDLRGRVGQLMVVTMEGSHMPTVSDLAFIRSYQPGGAMVRSVLQPSHAALYVTKLRGSEGLTGIPLFIGTNMYELVTRERGAPSGFAQLPSLLAVAATRDESAVEDLGTIMATQLATMGFDLHLGPNLSLAPTIPEAHGTLNTFGSDPAFVGRAGSTLFRVFDEAGILAVPSGFPGGGMDRVGRQPATLLTPAIHLTDLDLRPYIDLVRAGAPMIHVGDTHVPTLEERGGPACTSKVVLSGLLRGALHYEGVVLAGPMDIPAVLETMDSADAAILALRHGADMVLWRGASQGQMRGIDRVVQAVRDGIIPEGDLEAKVRRVLELKFARRLNARKKVREAEAEKLTKKRDLVARVYEVERRSITVVKNAGNVLPLVEEGSGPVGVTGTVGVEMMKENLEQYMRPVSQQVITTARHLGDITNFEVDRITRHIGGIRTMVCIVTDQLRPESVRYFIQSVKAEGPKVVAVLLGYPRALPCLEDADAIVLAYCDGADPQESLRAVGEVLAGRGAVAVPPLAAPLQARQGEELVFDIADVARTPLGRLPVEISEAWPAGLGVRLDPGLALKDVAWDFGDGRHGKGPRTTHTYAKAGEYTIALRVTDYQKQRQEQDFAIKVAE